MSELLINPIELATKLAHRELEIVMEARYGYNDMGKHIYEPENENEITSYTDEAQEVFDSLYDEYLEIIENCKVKYD